MARPKKIDTSPISKGAPAQTPQERENQLAAMAFDRVERRIQDGSASSQELVYFLKLVSERERLEQRNLEVEIALKEARREQIGSLEQQNALYEAALQAFTSYGGGSDSEE